VTPADFESIRVDLDPPVATITLDRPQALNAITPQMLAELAEALEHAGHQPAVVVVVLTGAGRAFSAGVDLKALGDRRLDDGKVGDLLDVPARRVIDLIGSLNAVVIAKVNGHCFTGALELALACDIVIAAEEAVLGDTHAKWGLRPTWGMSQRLPWLVGAARPTPRPPSPGGRRPTGVWSHWPAHGPTSTPRRPRSPPPWRPTAGVL